MWMILCAVHSYALIYEDDIEYIGSFALPQGDFGESRFGYSGRALAAYNDADLHTLFLEGHAHHPGNVAQVRIPDKLGTGDDLPIAEVLQDFHDITDGKLSSLGTNGYEAVFGLLPYDGRLIVGAASWYDAACQQSASHGISDLDLSIDDDFEGFNAIDAVADARSLGGYMTDVPAEWQERLGGPVLTGNSALSIISCISSGPAATVFNPDDLGLSASGSTIVYYPLSDYLVSGGVTDENTFKFGSGVKGIAFPSGSDSILFFGVQTMADGYCYGPGTTDESLHKVETEGGTYCYDLCSQYKGGHGYPYVHYVWAYDANDVLAVLSGDDDPWNMKPYAEWQLDDLDTSGCAGMRSAAYDPDTGRLYISQEYGEQPRIDVFLISSDACLDDADVDPCDGTISADELLQFIQKWKSGAVLLPNLMAVIDHWKG